MFILKNPFKIHKFKQLYSARLTIFTNKLSSLKWMIIILM